jgi:hypothetical protein
MSLFLPPMPRILPSLSMAKTVCRPFVRPPASRQVLPSSSLAHRSDCGPTSSLGRNIVPRASRKAVLIGCARPSSPTGPTILGNATAPHVAPLSAEVIALNGYDPSAIA